MLDNVKFGIVLAAVGGPAYHKQATLSLKSIKENSSSVPVCIFTDKVDYEGYKKADHIIYMKKPSKKIFQIKFHTLLNSPFDRTLFLDADTYVIQDLKHVFEVLDKHDLGFTHGHCRARRLDNIKNRPKLNYPPKSFTSIQGGFLLSKKSDATDQFWKNINNKYCNHGFFDDQIFIRMQMWDSPLKQCIFPMEYNLFRIKELKVSRCYIPYIVHYTTFKGKDVEKIIKDKLEQLIKHKNVSFKQRTLIYDD